MQKRFIASIFLLVCIGLVAGCSATYVHDSVTIEGSIQPDPKLFIETYNGNVSVIPTQGKNIEVEMEKWATGEKKQVVHDFILSDEIIVNGINDDGVTRITASRKNPTQPNPTGITNFGVHMTIKIPTETVKNLEVFTSNGSVHVDGVTQGASVTTSNAAVDFARVLGTMVVKTSNNSVSMVDVGGNLDIVTSNGGVKVRTTKVLKNVNITTSTGKIDYQSITDATGKYILHTTNNAIEMFLKRDSKLSFYAETSNGIISCDLPVTDTNPDQQILEGNLNAGGAEVNVKTSNGNINIHDDSK